MISVQKAIFPGIALGCLFLVFITSWIANPQVALASSSLADVSADMGVKTGEEPVLPAVSLKEAGPEDVPAVEETPVQTAAEPVDEIRPCTISANYPDSIQQWCDWIDRYAFEHGVESGLIAAVMLQESGGNPDAYSKSGAVGLMQVMPKDGLAASFMCINGPCFGSRPSMDELFNPEFNIAYGVRMLAGLIQRHGSVREALRAYGPMNMGYQYADIVLNIQERYR